QLDLNCRAAILIEQGSGRLLYEKNADERVPIASITKVMTLLLAFEAVHDGRLTMETPVPVSEHAYHMGGSQIWLEPGEQFTLDEMLKAICVSSANDAAVAVAELVGGSEPAFVEQMNARAAELGMEHTTFRNACGLDTEGHLSTARDVAIMSRTILNTCPEVLHYTGIWTDTLRDGQTQLVNTNKLLRRYDGITGLKTGTTGGAGVCITASATRDGLTLIAVVLGRTVQRRPVRRRHHPAGLRLCGLCAPRRCPTRRSGRSAINGQRAARRTASRWITLPCPRRSAGRTGAGRCPCSWN
ncbi:MAG: D-alanyl-D-alanine carboxypeptidase family protein, partial [Faecalibacterium prausnitzii]